MTHHHHGGGGGHHHHGGGGHHHHHSGGGHHHHHTAHHHHHHIGGGGGFNHHHHHHHHRSGWSGGYTTVGIYTNPYYVRHGWSYNRIYNAYVPPNSHMTFTYSEHSRSYNSLSYNPTFTEGKYSQNDLDSFLMRMTEVQRQYTYPKTGRFVCISLIIMFILLIAANVIANYETGPDYYDADVENMLTGAMIGIVVTTIIVLICKSNSAQKEKRRITNQINDKCKGLIESENEMLFNSGLKWIMPFDQPRTVYLWKDYFIKKQQEELNKQYPEMAQQQQQMGGAQQQQMGMGGVQQQQNFNNQNNMQFNNNNQQFNNNNNYQQPLLDNGNYQQQQQGYPYDPNNNNQGGMNYAPPTNYP